MSLHDVDSCENLSILTVQARQQDRLVGMQPNKVKPFPAATVPKLVHCRREKRGIRSEESRDAQRAYASKQKYVDDGEVEAWWECCTQHVGRTKERTW